MVYNVFGPVDVMSYSSQMNQLKHVLVETMPLMTLEESTTVQLIMVVFAALIAIDAMTESVKRALTSTHLRLLVKLVLPTPASMVQEFVYVMTNSTSRKSQIFVSRVMLHAILVRTRVSVIVTVVPQVTSSRMVYRHALTSVLTAILKIQLLLTVTSVKRLMMTYSN